MNEIFEGDGAEINRIAKWASTVFPRVFGLEVINTEVMKNLMI